MKVKERLENIKNPLLKWYKKNKRILPWRESKDAYSIWVSEIMLQQTRIEAVLGYYKRFIKEIPNIDTLANIEEEKLLKLWEGLGYYSRAKNLKKAAIKIQEEYDGKMPKHYADLIQLPGIGEYTAGAIASIAFNEKVSAIDGNVLRVISRVIGSKNDILLLQTKKEIRELLQPIIPKEAGNWNEALMELGETICIPSAKPLCEKCPIQDFCIAKQEGITDQIPVRINKTVRKKQYKTIFLLQYKDKIAIRKREAEGLLSGMYEFPNIDNKINQDEVQKQLKVWNLQENQIKKLKDKKHIFSHIEWEMQGYQIFVKKENKEFLWVNQEQLQGMYALPGAFSKWKQDLK